MAKINKSALPQKWIHSHEEDTETEMVFRPETYKFPPSRGRTSVEITPDGTAILGGIGPTDRTEHTPVRWKLEDADKLTFYQDSEATPIQVMEVSSVGKKRMTVKK